jgi:hypothetical protein
MNVSSKIPINYSNNLRQMSKQQLFLQSRESLSTAEALYRGALCQKPQHSELIHKLAELHIAQV